MRSRHHKITACRNTTRGSWARGVSVLLSFVGIASAHAGSPAADWRTDVQWYLAGATSYATSDGATVSSSALATAIELKFWSQAKPWYAGLFADYRVSLDRYAADMTSIGGYFRYDIGNWDATTFLFASRSESSNSRWSYLARLRYRVAENHKLGILATGSIRSAQRPVLALGYFGSLTDSLSVNLIADPGFNRGPDSAAHLEVIWQVR